MKNPIEQHVDSLDKELREMRPDVLRRARAILDSEVTVCSLHGKIGGKNNDYADCVSNRFVSSSVFLTSWLGGFNAKCKSSGAVIGDGSALADLMALFSDEIIYEYTKKFLERNFYKHYVERIRNKPEETFWKVWFGNDSIYGLFIAPQRCVDGSIRIDRSEIRRAKYNYWTIGHVMETGFYVEEEGEFYTFSAVEDFLKFYKLVLKRTSKSQYEKEIYSRYINYLEESDDVLSEPLLIPELRYEGNERKCLYRVDFTVLNPYTFRFIGFELSPSSSHMSVSGIKSEKKTQKAVNQELRVKWEREMHKRNDYLQKFGLSLITFTDSDLADIDNCFEVIKSALSERSGQTQDLNLEEQRLKENIRRARRR